MSLKNAFRYRWHTCLRAAGNTSADFSVNGQARDVEVELN